MEQRGIVHVVARTHPVDSHGAIRIKVTKLFERELNVTEIGSGDIDVKAKRPASGTKVNFRSHTQSRY